MQLNENLKMENPKKCFRFSQVTEQCVQFSGGNGKWKSDEKCSRMTVSYSNQRREFSLHGLHVNYIYLHF